MVLLSVKCDRTVYKGPYHVWMYFKAVNPFEPEFTIVIFIHYKPRIAAAILDL